MCIKVLIQGLITSNGNPTLPLFKALEIGVQPSRSVYVGYKQSQQKNESIDIKYEVIKSMAFDIGLKTDIRTKDTTQI